MRVLFRVDASAAIGAGHFARCATLASALIGRGADVALVTQGVPPALAHLVPAGASVRLVADEPEPVVAVAREQPGTIAVVDGYHFPATLLGELRAAGVFVVAIEDRLDVDPAVDLLIDANLYAERRRLTTRAAHALLGPSYALLRPEFRRARRDPARALERVAKVLVTVGGADPAGVSPRLVQTLATLETASPLEVVVVAPPSDPEPTIRATRAIVSTHHFEALAGVRDMAARMATSDVVVSAAGSTVLELACVGVPGVVLSVADNQVPVADEAAARGMVVAAGDARSLDAGRLADAILGLVDDPIRRRAMVDSQQAIVDGLGADRVARELFARFSRSHDRGTV